MKNWGLEFTADQTKYDLIQRLFCKLQYRDQENLKKIHASHPFWQSGSLSPGYTFIEFWADDDKILAAIPELENYFGEKIDF